MANRPTPKRPKKPLRGLKGEPGDPGTPGIVPDGDAGDIVVSGGGTVLSFDPTVVTAFARTILDDGSAAAVRTTLGAEATVAAGTPAQYYRGDKTWQTLDKGAVGLGNVDNTSDANKPVSTAQQTALDLKLNISAYTAADVLAKLLTVDGTGSGLDADLLDGQSGAYYLSHANHTGALPVTITGASSVTASFINSTDGSKLYFISDGTGATYLTATNATETAFRDLFFNASNHIFQINGAGIAGISSAGFSVTGTVTSTGNIVAPNIGTGAALVADTDGTLAANSDLRVATQKAVKTYADSLIAANDAMSYKGAIDCSSNPNYPAASAGHAYKVSAAGKIGGASGPNVEAGDLLLCLVDGTAAGTHAAVGTNWNIIQVNLDGAVIGPSSSTDNGFVRYDGTTGKLIKNGAAQIALATEISGFGTGVAAALAVNIGAAGAPVVFNGALGTPSSGSLVNCTFPTLNQNTTGSAATLTTSRSITATSDISWTVNFNGSANVSAAATIANGAVTYAKMQNVSATDRILGRSSAGAGVVQEITCTAAGRALIDDADAAAQRTTLGLGTAATVAYDEGTFTPGITFGGGATGLTYSNRGGWYRRIGNMVFFEVSIYLSAKGSSTGEARVTGLPYTVKAGPPYNTLPMRAETMAGTTALVAAAYPATTTVIMYNYAGNTITALTDANFNGTSVIYISGTYAI